MGGAASDAPGRSLAALVGGDSSGQASGAEDGSARRAGPPPPSGTTATPSRTRRPSAPTPAPPRAPRRARRAAALGERREAYRSLCGWERRWVGVAGSGSGDDAGGGAGGDPAAGAADACAPPARGAAGDAATLRQIRLDVPRVAPGWAALTEPLEAGAGEGAADWWRAALARVLYLRALRAAGGGDGDGGGGGGGGLGGGTCGLGGDGEGAVGAAGAGYVQGLADVAAALLRVFVSDAARRWSEGGSGAGGGADDPLPVGAVDDWPPGCFARLPPGARAEAEADCLWCLDGLLAEAGGVELPPASAPASAAAKAGGGADATTAARAPAGSGGAAARALRRARALVRRADPALVVRLAELGEQGAAGSLGLPTASRAGAADPVAAAEAVDVSRDHSACPLWTSFAFRWTGCLLTREFPPRLAPRVLDCLLGGAGAAAAGAAGGGRGEKGGTGDAGASDSGGGGGRATPVDAVGLWPLPERFSRIAAALLLSYSDVLLDDAVDFPGAVRLLSSDPPSRNWRDDRVDALIARACCL